YASHLSSATPFRVIIPPQYSADVWRFCDAAVATLSQNSLAFSSLCEYPTRYQPHFRGDACGDAPRTRRAVASAECQDEDSMPTLDDQLIDEVNALLEDARASVEMEVAFALGATEYRERETLRLMGHEDIATCIQLHEWLRQAEAPVS